MGMTEELKEKKEIFAEVVHQIRLNNPLLDIGTNHETQKVIWTDVAANEIVLPPRMTVENDMIVGRGLVIEVVPFGIAIEA